MKVRQRLMKILNNPKFIPLVSCTDSLKGYKKVGTLDSDIFDNIGDELGCWKEDIEGIELFNLLGKKSYQIQIKGKEKIINKCNGLDYDIAAKLKLGELKDKSEHIITRKIHKKGGVALIKRIFTININN
jgi:hypothetical protein